MNSAEALNKTVGGMKFAELAKIVSTRSKVDELDVKKTLKAAMAILKEQIESGERTRVAGLGVFSRTSGKEGGSVKIRFIPAEAKPSAAKEA
ncbi:MAG: HU family DNA-binding protein [Rhizomicrobium sp.]|jgi:nucleoid DNA-binding protein